MEGQGGPPPTTSLRAHAVARLELFDGFRLVLDERTVPLSMGTQRLLSFLALHGRPLRRIYIAASLWPDTTDEHASANLRSALWRLNHLRGGLVETTRSHLRLGSTLLVDVDTLARRARQLVGDVCDPSSGDLDMAMAGELLPDWYEEWLGVHRERLRQLKLHALEAMCRRFTAAGKFGWAVEAGVAAVSIDPLRESAHRALIAAHLAEGNVVEALRQYDGYRALLKEELGVDPSPSMENLLARQSVDASGEL